MTNIAFNMHIGPMLRAKYSISLAVLPIGLMFASFLPTWVTAEWLSILFEVPTEGPIKEMENGIWWLTLFLTFMVFSMIAGYLLGWVVNALICYLLLGWNKKNVYQVYMKSEVPQCWLKGNQSLEVVNNHKMNDWEETRNKGIKSYILKTGVLGWGLIMYIFMAVFPALRSTESLDLFYFFWQAVLWGVAGALFGYFGWFFSERQYKKHVETKS